VVPRWNLYEFVCVIVMVMRRKCPDRVRSLGVAPNAADVRGGPHVVILVADENGDVIGYAYAAVEGYDWVLARDS